MFDNLNVLLCSVRLHAHAHTPLPWAWIHASKSCATLAKFIFIQLYAIQPNARSLKLAQSQTSTCSVWVTSGFPGCLSFCFLVFWFYCIWETRVTAQLCCPSERLARWLRVRKEKPHRAAVALFPRLTVTSSEPKRKAREGWRCKAFAGPSPSTEGVTFDHNLKKS